MFRVIGIRPTGDFEVFYFKNRRDAKAKRKNLLNTHGYITVVIKK